MTRLARIEAAIRKCTDRRVLKILNRVWWLEVFSKEKERTKAA